jgi:hypothetical protein
MIEEVISNECRAVGESELAGQTELLTENPPHGYPVHYKSHMI